MNILAINTAGTRTEVAVMAGGREWSFQDEQFRQASAELMPAVDRLMREANLRPPDLDVLGVCIGPGSFTGIRIGLSAVRAMAYALGRKAVTVNLGEVLAYNMETDADSIVSVWDAGNGNAYVAAYENRTFRELLSPRCLTVAQAETFIKTIDEPYAVSTDAVMQSFGTVGMRFGLSRAVRAKIEAGMRLSYTELLPLYVRVSQAEQNARS